MGIRWDFGRVSLYHTQGNTLAPENGWLEDFLLSFWGLKRPIFRGKMAAVSFREHILMAFKVAFFFTETSRWGCDIGFLQDHLGFAWPWYGWEYLEPFDDPCFGWKKQVFLRVDHQK